MKDVALDPECRHFARRYLLAERIRAGVKRRRHDEPASRRRVADEADDGLERSKRLASPIDRDEREESVLDLVPLAGPWRIVATIRQGPASGTRSSTDSSRSSRSIGEASRFERSRPSSASSATRRREAGSSWRRLLTPARIRSARRYRRAKWRHSGSSATSFMATGTTRSDRDEQSTYLYASPYHFPRGRAGKSCEGGTRLGLTKSVPP